jgi:hypothetical protein
MELVEIRNNVEDYYGVDISVKNRRKEYSNARKMYSYVSRLNKHKFVPIGELIGQPHDVILYHDKVARSWIKSKDPQFLRELKDVFELKVKGDPEEIKLEKLHSKFDKTLMTIPLNLQDDILEMIETRVKASEWKHKDTLKLYIGLDTEMLGTF